jgi:hypothetical protein
MGLKVNVNRNPRINETKADDIARYLIANELDPLVLRLDHQPLKYYLPVARGQESEATGIAIQEIIPTHYAKRGVEVTARLQGKNYQLTFRRR